MMNLLPQMWEWRMKQETNSKIWRTKEEDEKKFNELQLNWIRPYNPIWISKPSYTYSDHMKYESQKLKIQNS